MEKLDFKKEYKDLYTASASKPKIIKIPPFNYLMVDGRGDPNHSAAFQQAIEALYSVSYTAKFMLKEAPETPDYVVPPLEGLWWAEDMASFEKQLKDQWQWTLMIMQPKWFNKKVFTDTLKKVESKKEVVALEQLRLEKFSEGTAAQIMHLGPYTQEKPTIDRLFVFIDENGYKLGGRHHEIYLSDPRRCKPERLKTIIRHPINKK